MPIHPTAIVQAGAKIAESAEIGPYCLVGPRVSIGARTRMMAHVFLDGDLEIGEDNIFFPYSTVGVASQDLKYRGEPSRTRIGHRNQIREFVTIHRGTEGGGMLTSIGDDNLLMAYVHVAHDARIGSHTVISHAATLGGHVMVEDWGIVGASSGVHQFCRVGRHAFIGGYSVITRDVLPFSNTVTEREARVFGANVTGLKRRGFAPSTIDALHKAFRLLTHSGLNTTQALERIAAEIEPSPELDELIRFIRSSERGFVK
ncbi:MAG TPA: acyl-ACP--UDP-N-acetylglucosamine O-acyltransferase [Bryobacteraceae bacterium]|jgi:UDP-N-acetylglucosamine acyltransferase|nr:acyl-ACP--UDP-N-acetylglucosamine O-acyltransferase [Bryobacteraceae bacterium]